VAEDFVCAVEEVDLEVIVVGDGLEDLAASSPTGIGF
jgi:hypothetical protein